LTERRNLSHLGEQVVIVPSTAGTLRNPNNFGKRWRIVREDLGVPEAKTHSFRKTAEDRYMSRGPVHAQVAVLLDRTVAMNDE
jgi:hypothetical protein